MTHRLSIFCRLTVALLVATSLADDVTASSGSAAILDNTSNGSGGTVTLQDESTQSDRYSIQGLPQDQVGDLIATVTHTDEAARLLNRTGRASSSGASSLDGTYFFSDDTAALNGVTNNENVLSEAAIIPSLESPAARGDYSLDNTLGEFVDLDDLSGRSSTQSTFVLRDVKAGERVGSFTGFTGELGTIVAVPEPSSIMVLACVSALLLRRRRH